MLDTIYAAMRVFDGIFYKEFPLDKGLELSKEVHTKYGAACGKRLVEKQGLKPTVEDAVKLFMLYSREVWGFGAVEYVKGKLESPTRGVVTNLACRGWELSKRAGAEALDVMKKITCPACEAEYNHLVGLLSPDISLRQTKGFPRGDECCEFIIEKKS